MADYIEQNFNVRVRYATECDRLEVKDQQEAIRSEYPVQISARRWPSSTEKAEPGSFVEQTIHAKYVVGCDGAHSWTRKQAGIVMEGSKKSMLYQMLEISLA